MPVKKVSAASSKATTNTPCISIVGSCLAVPSYNVRCPQGHPAAKKVIKSSEFVDSEAKEA
jgi:hypothetical protein